MVCWYILNLFICFRLVKKNLLMVHHKLIQLTIQEKKINKILINDIKRGKKPIIICTIGYSRTKIGLLILSNTQKGVNKTRKGYKIKVKKIINLKNESNGEASVTIEKHDKSKIKKTLKNLFVVAKYLSSLLKTRHFWSIPMDLMLRSCCHLDIRYNRMFPSLHKRRNQNASVFM